MSKVNVWGLEREEAPIHDVEITSTKGEVFSFKIQAPDSLGASLMVDRYNELVERYITGGVETAVMPFPPINGREVVVSRTAFQVATTLESSCIGDDAYTAEEFIALSNARPDVVQELLVKVQGLQGNALQGGSTPEQHSSASSWENPDSTPTL